MALMQLEETRQT